MRVLLAQQGKEEEQELLEKRQAVGGEGWEEEGCGDGGGRGKEEERI